MKGNNMNSFKAFCATTLHLSPHYYCLVPIKPH
jgi:hypothetical protein